MADILASPLGNPAVDPDDIIDNLVEHVKASLKETQQQPLGDMKVSGVIFTGGILTGMENLARWGNAVLETK